jgi:hypothetical protein
MGLCRAKRKPEFWGSNFSVRAPPLGQTIGLRAGRGRGPNSSPSWGIVLEEADETVFWLELLLEGGIVKHEKLDALVTEAQELTSIFVTSLRAAKGIAS